MGENRAYRALVPEVSRKINQPNINQREVVRRYSEITNNETPEYNSFLQQTFFVVQEIIYSKTCANNGNTVSCRKKISPWISTF